MSVKVVLIGLFTVSTLIDFRSIRWGGDELTHGGCSAFLVAM